MIQDAEEIQVMCATVNSLIEAELTEVLLDADVSLQLLDQFRTLGKRYDEMKTIVKRLSKNIAAPPCKLARKASDSILDSTP